MFERYEGLYAIDIETSVFFRGKVDNGRAQPCKKFFLLYRNNPSGDIPAFCVIYDLTEQKRQDKNMGTRAGPRSRPARSPKKTALARQQQRRSAAASGAGRILTLCSPWK